MKRNVIKLLIFSSAIYLVSCKKDSSANPATGNVNGTYKFVSLTANTTSTVTITDGTTTDKTITKSVYTTKDNAGTLTIDDTKVVSTGLSYSIDTVVTVESYEDGVLTDTEEVPFQFDVPSSSATSEYKWVGTDSMYFASGSVFTDGTTTPSGPSGAKIKLEGGKLYVTGKNEKTSQDNSSGYLITTNSKASVVATYQKQ
ncbi:MAG: hypothetical protein ABUT20_49620 [Bacteroidota bacterium]